MDTVSEHLKKVRISLFKTDVLMHSGNKQDIVELFTLSVQSFIVCRAFTER